MNITQSGGTLSVRDAAEYLSIGRTKIYELNNTNQIETIKLGRRRLVKRNSLLKLVGETDNG